MAKEFSIDQQKAIDNLEQSILVSAAAGSGKTTVLVERIIHIILEGKANVDEMLVVTFTKAAAQEMRLRLAAAIRDRIKKSPDDAPRLKEQLSRLYKSYISTIDKFAIRLIKEFFHETDVEPGFAICDEVQGELMRREAASELIEEAYERDDIIPGASFREFMRLYGEERSDENFASGLISSYKDLRTMPDYFEWAKDKASLLLINEETFEGSDLAIAMREDAMRVFEICVGGMRKIREIMDDAGASEYYERAFNNEAETIFGIYSELCTGKFGSKLLDSVNYIEFANLTSVKPNPDEKESYASVKEEVKNIRNSVKEEIKSFKSKYLVPDLKTGLDEMNRTYRYTLYYMGLLEEFEKRYDAKKKEKKLLDFNDTMHIASDILKNEDAAKALQKRFKFIFVDEYQDTNNIQDHLIAKVSSPRNVFKVGDVKQSIYKFRLAEPENFERLYKEYADESNKDGVVINLSENYRTNPATINYINKIFENVMDGYDENAKLNAALKCPDEYDFKPELHILLKKAEDEAVNEEETWVDPEIEELSNDEAESEYIADIVNNIIGKEFYDSKTGEVRKAHAKDIAVLYYSVKKKGEQLSRALAARSIASHIEETDEYFDALEVNIALSMLSCIDNMRRDIPLISALHSEIFSFSPDDLAHIRISQKESTGEKTSYHDAFTWYISNGPDDSLRVKCKAAYEQITEWKELSRMMPLADFIWKVLVDSGYYRHAGAMSDGGRRQANLRALADRAATFAKEGGASLSSFINFVEIMKSKEISNGQAPMAGKDDDLVRISTMHKSKGLEFPFVILGGLGRTFKRDSDDKSFSFDSHIGVGMPYINPDRRYWRTSLMQKAIKSKSDSDGYKEDLRLLYVDMTRARNKLYMVGMADNLESLDKIGRPTNYLRVLKDYMDTPFNEYHIKPLIKKAPKSASKKMSKDICIGDLSRGASLLYDEIDRRFSFTYPAEELLNIKAKYSVSEIRRMELEKEQVMEADMQADIQADTQSEELANLGERSKIRKKAAAADIGIAYHRIMEFLDFNKVMSVNGEIDTMYIKERAEYLRDQNAIEGIIYAELSMDKIAAFFESDIGRRALKATSEGLIKKEKPFTLKTTRNEREILIQGVIDCCFEEDGRMVLIDYKSNYINPGKDKNKEIERIKREYTPQIEMYKEAIVKGTGRPVKESYLYLFDIAEAVPIIC